MKTVATGRGILIYPKPINGPKGIQTQNSWLRIFCCSICIFVVSSDGPLHIQCPYGAGCSSPQSASHPLELGPNPVACSEPFSPSFSFPSEKSPFLLGFGGCYLDLGCYLQSFFCISPPPSPQALLGSWFL